MTDEAEVTMLMYADLEPEEEAKLKSVDGDVAGVLSGTGIRNRAVWQGCSGVAGRSVRLCITRDTELYVLLVLSEAEVAALSAREVVSRLRASLR